MSEFSKVGATSVVPSASQRAQSSHLPHGKQSEQLKGYLWQSNVAREHQCCHVVSNNKAGTKSNPENIRLKYSFANSLVNRGELKISED